MDHYVEFCEDLLKNIDMEFMLRFHKATQIPLYISRCAYEKDPSHLFEFASQTCALDILTDLINEKYNQSQILIEYNQLDVQGDYEDEEVREDFGNLNDERKDESFLGPHDEKNDFENTCWRR